MSKVYFIDFKSMRKFKKLLFCAGLDRVVSRNDMVAIKLHFGEKGNKGYVKPEYINRVVEEVKGLGGRPFVTDSNTIYVGERSDALKHLLIARTHGFSLESCGAPVIIADGLRGNSFAEVEIGQKHFQKIKVASAIYDADTLIFVTHFKGHELGGFGGAIKNIGMGGASRIGKYEIHEAVVPKIDLAKCTGCGLCIKWCPGGAIKIVDKKVKIDSNKCTGCGECILYCNFGALSIEWSKLTESEQEKLVEYAFGVLKNKKALFINFLNFITRLCDCCATTGGPVVPDIGILASSDPVAIDNASVNLVNEAGKRDVFRELYPGKNWEFQLNYAEKLGMGTRDYELVRI
jgi:hypothetical protein